MTEYLIRPATETDLDVLAGFEVDIAQVSFGDEAITDPALHRKRVAGALGKPGEVTVVAAAALLDGWGIAALVLASLLAWGWAAHLRRRLGGFTGDTLGALVEITEALVLTLAVSLDFLELV